MLQGEARRVADNIPLGEFTVPLPRVGGDRERGVDVRFTYDTNGILEVTATTVADGAAARLVIQGNADALPPAEVERRLQALDALKVHPRDQAPYRALLARGARLYEELLGDARAAAGHAIVAFEAALDTQDPRTAATAAEEFTEQLNRLDTWAGW